MEGKNLYHLIYGYLLARIRFGFYSKGERLPSIHRLSRLFGVSTMAVRGALKLLEEEGYISGESDNKNVVVYDAVTDDKKLPANFSLGEDDLMELHKSLELIFPDIFFYGLTKCKEGDIRELYRILERPSASWDEPAAAFLAYLVMRLNNSLLLDLYYDVLLFSYPAYLSLISKDMERWKGTYDELRAKLQNLLTVNKGKPNDALWETIRHTYLDLLPVSGLSITQEKESIYQWGKPQILISSANEIVTRIFFGRYPILSYLPSARILAEELDIAVITMRRSIALLNALGITESINGRGTRILPPEEGLKRVKWQEPAVRKNIIRFLESLHILAITCRSLALAAFLRLGGEKREKMVKEIELTRSRGHEGIALAACLYPLIDAIRLPSLKVIYNRLMSLLFWGIPFTNMLPRIRLSPYTDRLIAGLNGGNPDEFAAALEQVFSAIFLSSRSKAISVGIREADRLKLPSGFI